MKILIPMVGLIIQGFGMILIMLMFLTQARWNDGYTGMAAMFVGVPVTLASAIILGLIWVYDSNLPVKLRNWVRPVSALIVLVTLLIVGAVLAS